MNDAVPDKLLVLWTSNNPELARHMVFLYAINALRNGWWKQLDLMVWGPSQPLLAADADIQELLKELQAAGARTQACITCADRYGLTDKLRSLNIEVFGMGLVLTNWLKSENQVLTV